MKQKTQTFFGGESPTLIKLTLHSAKVSFSPSSPLLFAIVFWGETNRNSLSQVFSEIDVLKYFTNFTGKR